MNTNSHRSGSAVLVSGEICFRLTAHNHMGRLKKKFNYKFNSPTVTANCTWRRSSDFSRSIIAPRVVCNSDDRSFIVSQSSWRQKSSNSNQLRINSLKKMDPLVVVHLQLYTKNPLFSIILSASKSWSQRRYFTKKNGILLFNRLYMLFFFKYLCIL